MYSFAWDPTRVAYAIDGNWNDANTITTNVPQNPGMLSLSHWSDGNPNFSGGPPTSPTAITVSSMTAYYNATGATLACKHIHQTLVGVPVGQHQVCGRWELSCHGS